MQLDDVAALASPAGRALLAALPRYEEAEALRRAGELRAAGHPAALVAAVLTQSRLRARARLRFGPLADRLLFTPEGLEQATRPPVAGHRARRYAAAGLADVVDLGCGVGSDLLALAAAGLTVRGVERDAVTAAVAAENARALGLADRVTIECAAADAVDLTGAASVFADPARRADGRRVLAPQRWSPPLPWLLALPVPALGLKVAPGLPHAAVPDDCELEVVSHHGDVVEGALYRGPLRTPGVRRRATVLSSASGPAETLPAGNPPPTLTDADLPPGPPPVGAVGAVLYEPDGAVIRAGLVGAVAARLAGRLVDPTIAYVTSERVAPTPFAAGYQVEEVMPFNLKRLRAVLRQRGVGQVVVKKRGSAVAPDELRRLLRLDGRGPTQTLVLTRVRGEQTVLLVRPLAGT